jgi:hypothetical protein
MRRELERLRFRLMACKVQWCSRPFEAAWACKQNAAILRFDADTRSPIAGRSFRRQTEDSSVCLRTRRHRGAAAGDPPVFWLPRGIRRATDCTDTAREKWWDRGRRGVARDHRSPPREPPPRVPEHAIDRAVRQGRHPLAIASGRRAGFRRVGPARMQVDRGRGSSHRQGAEAAAGENHESGEEINRWCDSRCTLRRRFQPAIA